MARVRQPPFKGGGRCTPSVVLELTKNVVDRRSLSHTRERDTEDEREPAIEQGRKGERERERSKCFMSTRIEPFFLK